MKFDITALNKVTLLQCLYAFSEPIALGHIEYQTKKEAGENVEGLTQEECESYLSDFYKLYKTKKNHEILDYCNGKPQKIIFEVKKENRIILDTSGYDERNGLFRSFEALLNAFLFEEIKIVNKGYTPESIQIERQTKNRPKEEQAVFKSIIKDLVHKSDSKGKYWAINPNKEEHYNKLLGLNLLNS